jgi:hypothetical protein
MTPPEPSFQELLFWAYTEEAACYGRALDVARELPETLKRGGSAAESLKEIQALLNEVALIEARIAEAKQRWQASCQEPGRALKRVLERVTELIQALTCCMHEADEKFRQVSSTRFSSRGDTAA